MNGKKRASGPAGTVREIEFAGEQAWELSNEFISCMILPRCGGKVLSLTYRDNGFEFLFQNPRGSFGNPQAGSPFEAFEACGFDDAFPSIDPSRVTVGDRVIDYPDHGEIWSAGFDCQAEEDGMKLSFRSRLLPYSYEKRLSLHGDMLRCSYQIANVGTVAFPCIWACHCLAAYMPDMRLVYPEGTETLEVVLDSERLGLSGTVHSFPVSSDGAWDFTRVPGTPPAGMDKYYVRGKVKEGKFGYIYPSAGMAAELLYDADKLPYLGFWITTGGYRGDKNCAFEPASGYYDSIETAGRNGCLMELGPGERMVFELGIRLYPWKQGDG